MKFVKRLLTLIVMGLLSFACSHKNNETQSSLSDYSPEQLDELNRAALVIASKKIEEQVIKVKGNPEMVTFLATDLFLKGNMSLLESDYPTATVLFKNLVELVPNDEFLQKKYAISLIRSGELETSAEVLSSLYAKSADEKVGLILAGVYTGIDDEESARKIYQKILAKNAKNEDACVFLGKSLALAKKTTQAIQKLENCSKNNAKNGMYHYYIGKIYLDMGLIPKAMMSFKTAYKKQPDLSQAVSALGVLLEEREQHNEAIKIYEKYLKNEPLDTAILTRIVQTLFFKERFAEVIPYAERLSDLENENLNLKVKLGILYTDAKKYPQALSVFKELLAAAPHSDKILYYLGAIHQELSQYQESIEYFNQIPTSSALYTDSSVQMATMLSHLALSEHYESSEKNWEKKFLKLVSAKIEELKDLRVEFSVIKAGYYEGTGLYKEAMETMMVVQDEKNFSIQHKYYLANLYEKEKKFEESTSIVMGILEKEPRNAHAWNFLGYSLVARDEQMEKAYEYIQKALKIDPNDGYIRDSLGWYYFKKGLLTKALPELEFAFKKVPNDVEILKHLAIIHKELKNYKRAKNFFETALRHVRYQNDKKEILSELEELDTKRFPASESKD